MARRTLNSSANKRKSAPSARRSRTTVARKSTAAAGAATSSRSNVRGKARTTARTTAKRGFAAMSPQRRRSIAAKGGRARAAA
jgi:hypothetical protein